MRRLEYGHFLLSPGGKQIFGVMLFGCLALACTSSTSGPHSTGEAGQGGFGGDGGGSGGQGGMSAPTCDGTPAQWCGYDAYCDAPAGNCPSASGLGTCALRPNDCTGEPMQPVCACKGQIYINACEAHAAGYDEGSQQDCMVPANSYLCGPVLCEEGTTFCERVNAYYHCMPLPELCKTTDAMCDCLMGMHCMSAPGQEQCLKDANGHFVVTCEVTE